MLEFCSSSKCNESVLKFAFLDDAYTKQWSSAESVSNILLAFRTYSQRFGTLENPLRYSKWHSRVRNSFHFIFMMLGDTEIVQNAKLIFLKTRASLSFITALHLNTLPAGQNPTDSWCGNPFEEWISEVQERQMHSSSEVPSV